MATPNYNVNYDDERFSQVETDKQTALSELEQTYGGMIEQSDSFYQAQIDASKEWADKQSQLQQEQTDFAIEQIEQQKEQTHKDYLKEQSGAYVDWQKQSNEYGVESEKMASAGLDATGFSESSQVSMYNTYQMRVATARETFNRAVLAYDNSIQEAKLQNNAILAEIAYQALQEQLSLSLEGFQYKNNLILEQANKKVELENIYYNRWQDVLNQINTENDMAEKVRQFNENLSFQEEQKDKDRQHQSDEAALERKFKEEQAKIERQHEKDMLAAETKAEKEKIEKEYEEKKAYLAEQLKQEKELLKYEYDLKQKAATRSYSYSTPKTKTATVTKAANNGYVDQTPTVSKPANPYYPINQSSANKVAKDLEIKNMTPETLESLIRSGKVTYNPSTKTVKVASWVTNMNKITNKYFGISFVK
jgi:hypothetical protein